MSPSDITAYLESPDFINDCKALTLLPPEDQEAARWMISLKWSENLIEMGEFPSIEQAEVIASFVLGEIPTTTMLYQLKIGDELAQRLRIALA